MFTQSLSKEDIQFALDHDKPVYDFSERHPVYHYAIKNQDVVVKFVGAASAKQHELNTILFQFFDLPFVDCFSMRLNNKTRDNFYKRKNHHHRYGHVVVMPFLNAKPPKEFEQDAYLADLMFSKKIKPLIPALAILGHHDVDKYNNGLLSKDMKKLYLVDAEHGLANKNGYLMSVEDIVRCHFATCYDGNDMIPKSFINPIQELLVNSADKFKKKIDQGLPEPLFGIKTCLKSCFNGRTS